MSTGNESAPHRRPLPRQRLRRPQRPAARRSDAPWPVRRPRRDRPASDARIAIDDFMKVELRVAKVLEAEAVPKSKKLIKLKVDAGTEQRTIVAGIAEAYQPEQLVGRTIVIVANLKPREADGHRVERHGARREPRGRTADAGRGRSEPSRRRASPVTVVNSQLQRQRPITPESIQERDWELELEWLGVGSWQLGVDMIDSHCHLAGDEFAGDLDEVVGRATDAGLSAHWSSSAPTTIAELARAADVAGGVARRPVLDRRPSARGGKFAADPAEAARQVAGGDRRPAAGRAVGEIGLDYHYDFAPRDVQQAGVPRADPAGAEAATADRHPHARSRRRYVPDSRRGERRRRSAASSTASPATARWRSGRSTSGFYLSLAGIVTFPRALELKEVAKMVPLDRLLIETDSPFLAPVPHRGKRNEPAHVARVAEVDRGAARNDRGGDRPPPRTRIFVAPVQPVTPTACTD